MNQQFIEKHNIYINQIAEETGLEKSSIYNWLKGRKHDSYTEYKITRAIAKLYNEMMEKRQKLLEVI